MGSGLGAPGEMVRVKFRRVNVDVTNMVDVKGLRVTAPVQGNVIVWVELFAGGTMRSDCDELDLVLERELRNGLWKVREIEEVVDLNTPVPGRDEVLLVKTGREEVRGVLPLGVLLALVVILEVVTVEE